MLIYYTLNITERELYNKIVEVTLDQNNVQGLIHFATMQANTDISKRIVKVANAIVDDYDI